MKKGLRINIPETIPETGHSIKVNELFEKGQLNSLLKLFFDKKLEEVSDEKKNKDGKTFQRMWWHDALECARTLRYDKNKMSATNYIMHGLHKIIFKITYNDETFACGLEITDQKQYERKKYTFKKLGEIKNCNMMIPAQMKRLNFGQHRIIITKMPYCVEGDIFDFDQKQNEKGEKYTAEERDQLFKQFISLARVLDKIHERGMYVIDIKPENILICNCQKKKVLAFADLDDVVFKNEDKPYPVMTLGYSFQMMNSSFTGALKDGKPKDPNKYNKAMEWTDWNAFANTVIALYSWTLYKPNNYCYKFDARWLYSMKENCIKGLKDVFEKYDTPLAKLCLLCAQFLIGRTVMDNLRDLSGDFSYPNDDEVRDRQIKTMVDFVNSVSEKENGNNGNVRKKQKIQWMQEFQLKLKF